LLRRAGEPEDIKKVRLRLHKTIRSERKRNRSDLARKAWQGQDWFRLFRKLSKYKAANPKIPDLGRMEGKDENKKYPVSLTPF